ncbi:hypothetical protein Patl1_14163 [Pistacia atlantica]|uniref:Uncharacterized protein n=1 Tax=Pistacia atlantica TaxID=434234 RepID=A0ACC1AWC0_9ROSI|nr:hypothetical protein Patl1_14163 [Pistacia atlantica]
MYLVLIFNLISKLVRFLSPCCFKFIIDVAQLFEKRFAYRSWYFRPKLLSTRDSGYEKGRPGTTTHDSDYRSMNINDRIRREGGPDEGQLRAGNGDDGQDDNPNPWRPRDSMIADLQNTLMFIVAIPG